MSAAPRAPTSALARVVTDVRIATPADYDLNLEELLLLIEPCKGHPNRELRVLRDKYFLAESTARHWIAAAKAQTK